MQTGGKTRDNPEAQQRLRTTPRAEYGEHLDVCRPHYAHCEEGEKAHQAYGCADQGLNQRNSERVFINGNAN